MRTGLESSGRTEEEAFPWCVRDDVVGRRAQHLHDTGQLFDLVFARENRVARVEFDQDAACVHVWTMQITRWYFIFI